MKSFAFIVIVAQAIAIQCVYSSVIRSCGSKIVAPVVGPAYLPTTCTCSTPAVVSTNVMSTPVYSSQVISAPFVSSPIVSMPNVANSLADTLSLLTVSSLLADTLPLSYPNVVTSLPVVGGCGCGGLGYTVL